MLITFDEFLERLKQLGDVYRDTAPRKASYPYFTYSFTRTQRVIGSSGVRLTLNEYQVSLFTKGTESELKPFMAAFADVPFRDFAGQPASENDIAVTNFYTYLQVIADE